MKTFTIEEIKNYLISKSFMKTFTIEEIKKYILSKDSIGDVVFYLSEDNIVKANLDDNKYLTEEQEDDDYRNFMPGDDSMFNPF